MMPPGSERRRRRRSLFLAAAAVAALAPAACVKVGPDFEKPAAPMTEQWIEEEDARVKRQQVVYTDWWKVFDDPVLDRLIDIAYRQNLDLLTAGLRVIEARAQLGIAIGEQYPQTQALEAGYSRERISENAPNSADADNSYDNLSVGLDASWEIDFWGRFQRSIESADSGLGATIADYDDLLVILTAEVATTYVQIREFEQRIRLIRRNVAIQQDSLRLTEIRYNAGAVSQLDLQEALALLEDTRSALPEFQASQRQAENALATLLGMPPIQIRRILAPDAPIPKAPRDVAIGIPADLLRRRPDIRQAELNAAAQSAQIGVAKADLYPRVTLAGFVGFQTAGSSDFRSNNAQLTDLLDSDSFTYFVGPAIQWNFLNYGRITNNVRVQDARLQQLIAEYQDTVLRAYQEVEDGLVSFLKAQEQTDILERSVEASQKAVTLSVLQYSEGVATYTRVLTTQQNLVQRQDRLTQAQSGIAQGLIATYRALGGGWQSRDINDVVPDTVLEEMRARTDWGNIIPTDDLEEAPSSTKDVQKIDTLFRAPDF
ncbi:MAG: efflux transporter outer membrane subunit [Kiloniellales bacterium]|nr:efflux transporter outer membrane subunit [Kiloniellales bacterium]